MVHFRPKIGGGEPVARSLRDRICVIAWQGHRGDKLHLSTMRSSWRANLIANGRALNIGRLQRPPTN